MASLEHELRKLNDPSVNRFRVVFRRRDDWPPVLFFPSAVGASIHAAAAFSLDWSVASVSYPDKDTVVAVVEREPVEFRTAGVNPTVAVVVAGVIVSAVAAVVVVVQISPVLESAPGVVAASVGAATVLLAVAGVLLVYKSVRS